MQRLLYVPTNAHSVRYVRRAFRRDAQIAGGELVRRPRRPPVERVGLTEPAEISPRTWAFELRRQLWSVGIDYADGHGFNIPVVSHDGQAHELYEHSCPRILSADGIRSP